MEVWDLYREDRSLSGLSHIRGEPVPDGYYHLVVHVWIRNSEGCYLISRRSARRPTFPLMWECVGGSVTLGEDSITGAIREAMEEVGTALSPEKGQLLFSRTRKHFHDILDVWLFSFDAPVDLAAATTDEVSEVRWMTPEQIKGLFESGQMVHTLDYFFTEVVPF